MKDIQYRKDVEFLVDRFYEQVLQDDKIGFLFTEVVQLNWEIHIPVMYDFWESILLGSMTYKGNPMLKHLTLNQKSPLEEQHFERWLSLWKHTLNAHFKGEKADQALKRATQIAQLMQFKIQQLAN